MDLLSPHPGLIVWTIITFVVVLVILRSKVWGPLLLALDEREQRIREALESADRVREEARAQQAEHEKRLAEAETQARQIVTEKLQAVQTALPEDVDPPVLAPISSIMGEIMVISVPSAAGGDTDPMTLRSLADWTLRRRLLAVPGVSQVVPIGGEVRQYQVLVKPAKLAAYNVTLHEVLEAAGQSNANFSGGRFTEAGQEYLIRGTGRVRNVDDVGNTVVATRGGTPVRIGDVARVEVGPAIKFGDGSADGEPAVIVIVQKQPDANTLELTAAVERTVEDIRRGLPADVTIDTHIFRQADFIQIAIDNVLEALRDGAILVIVVLFLFLWNARATVISALAIPLSLVAAIFVFWLLDITINTMTINAITLFPLNIITPLEKCEKPWGVWLRCQTPEQ